MLERKITKIIEAGFYTKDGEKIIDVTDTCIPYLLGETIISKKDNSEEKSDDKV